MKKVLLVLLLLTIVSCSDDKETLDMLRLEMSTIGYPDKEGYKIISYTAEEVPTESTLMLMRAYHEDQIVELPILIEEAKRYGWENLHKLYQKQLREHIKDLNSLKDEIKKHPRTLTYWVTLITVDGREVERGVDIRL
tara:strand:+ start:388 stop:801 length:414 start_codon:yes stop_codon:yes gene_type:complete